MSEPPFQRIGIVGLGLIGGSIALRARERWPDMTLVGCDRPAALEAAGALGIVDRLEHAVAGLAGTDLIVLAAPIEAMCEMMPALAPLADRAVVTDVGSTKRLVMAAASHAGLRRFVGGHPMSGSEQGGLAHARADLFRDRPWMLVASGADPDREIQDDARRMEEFVQGLGGVPQWIDAETHDRVVAYISHVPQLLAVALMNATVDAVGARGLAASGRAFREMTRLASSPADLWQGILAGNVDNVTAALQDVIGRLPASEDLRGRTWVADAFSRSDTARRRLLGGHVVSD